MKAKNSNLSYEAIVCILKTCSESGVSSLKFGDLYVEFGKSRTNAATSPAAEMAEIEHIQEDHLTKEEVLTKEEQLAHMLVEDPSMAEELLIKGELEKDDAGIAE